jgi:hypothetical protein
LAARRRARPTASENSLLVCTFRFGFGFRFTATFPITLRSYRVIIHAPRVSQKTVLALKIVPAPREAAQDILAWHVVATLLYSCRDTAQRELRG